MFSFYQKSINKKIQFKGIGLHTGKKVNMTLLPASPNHGIIFKRIDLKTKNLIEANFLNVRDALLCTKIENEFKASVSTIEHLMGALYGEKINNLLIEIDSSELPIMDGSAKDFIEKIKEVGVKQYDTLKKYIKVLKKFEYNVGKKTISIEPEENDLIIDFEIIYQNPLIGKQRKKISLLKDKLTNVYNSRTFCLFEDIEKVKKAGLGKGGSLDNAIVVQNNKILNQEGLRNDNEFVLHKILDCLGDLALSKHPLLGKITCSQGGHKLANDFLRRFFMDKSNYSVIEFKENKLPNSLLYTESLAASA